MAALNNDEILAGLRKIGIDHESDINFCLNEYRSYCCLQKLPYSEKRKCKRIPTGEDIKISFNRRWHSGTVLNISEKGMFIGTKKSFRPGTVLYVEGGTLKVLVKVKRLRKMTGYYDGIGVEVVKPSSIYLQYIKKITSPL